VNELVDSVLRHFWRDHSPLVPALTALLRRAVLFAAVSNVDLGIFAEARPPLRIRRFLGVAA